MSGSSVPKQSARRQQRARGPATARLRLAPPRVAALVRNMLAAMQDESSTETVRLQALATIARLFQPPAPAEAGTQAVLNQQAAVAWPVIAGVAQDSTTEETVRAAAIGVCVRIAPYRQDSTAALLPILQAGCAAGAPPVVRAMAFAHLAQRDPAQALPVVCRELAAGLEPATLRVQHTALQVIARMYPHDAAIRQPVADLAARLRDYLGRAREVDETDLAGVFAGAAVLVRSQGQGGLLQQMLHLAEHILRPAEPAARDPAAA